MERGKKNVAVTSQQAPECEMTVTNYCGYIAHGEKQKRNLLVWKRFLFKGNSIWSQLQQSSLKARNP